MRHIGNGNEYNSQRDAELMASYERALSVVRPIVQTECIRMAVNSPCSRFWVSEERAYTVMCSMLGGRGIPSKRKERREMFEEIYRRVVALMGRMPLKDAVFKVVYSPAPKFYLTEQSAIVLLCRRRKWEIEKRDGLLLR